jgi:hypothetical protein
MSRPSGGLHDLPGQPRPTGSSHDDYEPAALPAGSLLPLSLGEALDYALGIYLTDLIT